MRVPLGETIYGRECIVNATGAAANADSLPTIDVSENGTTPATMGGTVANVTTGIYRWTLPCTTGNGFEVGKWYDVMINTTVGGISSSKRVAQFRIDDTVAPDVNVTKWSGTTVSAAGSGTKHPLLP